MRKPRQIISLLLLTVLCLSLLPPLPAAAAEKPSPRYVPVETKEDFFIGGEYLLVAEAGGKHYALACTDPAAYNIFDTLDVSYYDHMFYRNYPVEVPVDPDGSITAVPPEAVKLTFHESARAGRGSNQDYFAVSLPFRGKTQYLTASHDSSNEAIRVEESWNPSYTYSTFKAVALPDGQSSITPYYLMSDGNGNLLETPSSHIRFYSKITLKAGSLLSCPPLPANCFYIDSPESLGDLGTFTSNERDENGEYHKVVTRPGGYEVVEAPVKLYRRSDCTQPAHEGKFTASEGITVTMQELEPNVYTVKFTGDLKVNDRGRHSLLVTWHLPAGALNFYSAGARTLEEAKTRTFADAAAGYQPDIPKEKEFHQRTHVKEFLPEFEAGDWWYVYFPANFQNRDNRVQSGDAICWKPDFSGLVLKDENDQPLPGVQAGDQVYHSLAQAFETAPDPDGWVRVKLLGDRDYFNPGNFRTGFEVPKDAKVELDLNGHYLRLNDNGRLFVEMGENSTLGGQLVIVNSRPDAAGLCGVFSDGTPVYDNYVAGAAQLKAGLYHTFYPEDIARLTAEGFQYGELTMPFTWYDAYYGQETVNPNKIKTELKSYYLVTPAGTKLTLTADGQLSGAFAGAQPLTDGVEVTNPVTDHGYHGTTKERTEIALRRSGSDTAYTTLLPAAVRKTFQAYGPSLRLNHTFGAETVDLILPSEALTKAQQAVGDGDLSLSLQRSSCTDSRILSAWETALGPVAPDSMVNVELSAENGSEYRLYTVTADGAVGEHLGMARGYNGKVSFAARADQLARFALVRGCLHNGMKHSAEVASGCMENGTLEYWYCPVCNHYYQDAAGTQLFSGAYSPSDLLNPAPGHTDADDDGVCDRCKKAMPTFVQVTKQEEIKAGETYLMVIRDGGKLYGLHTITKDQTMEYIYPDTKIPATAALTPEADGSIKYKTMKEAGGMLVTAKIPYSTHNHPMTGEGLCLWADPCGIWRAFDVTDSDYCPLRFGFAPNDKYNVYDVRCNPDGTVLVEGIVSLGGAIAGAKDGSGQYYFHIADEAGNLVPYGYGGKGDISALTPSGELLLYKMVAEEGAKPQPQASSYTVRVRHGVAQAPGYVESESVKAKAGETVTLKLRLELESGTEFVRWEAVTMDDMGNMIPVTVHFRTTGPDAAFIMPDLDLELMPVVRAAHDHVFENWQDGRNGHYQQCTVDGCTYRTPEEPHTFTWTGDGQIRQGTCSKCHHQVTQYLTSEVPLEQLPSPYEGKELQIKPKEDRQVSYNPSAAAAIQEAAEQAGAASIALKLEETDGNDPEHTPQQKEALAAASAQKPKAYQVELVCRDSAEQELQEISYFGKTGRATITAPYEPGLSGEVRVSRITEEGLAEKVPCTYDAKTGLVTWSTQSHSLYLITCQSAKFVLSSEKLVTGVRLTLDGALIPDNARCMAAAYNGADQMVACGMVPLTKGQTAAEIDLGCSPEGCTIRIFLMNRAFSPLLKSSDLR